MPISYPASIDVLTNPTADNAMNSPSHSQQHADANDLLEALMAKVGIDNSNVTTSLDYRVRAGEVSFVTTTTDRTVQATDRIILCDATSGALTITVPTAASSANRLLKLLKIDASDNFVTVTISGGGTLTVLPSQGVGVEIGSNSSAWYILP